MSDLAENDIKSDDFAHESNLKMLGDENSKFDKIIGFLSWPKLNTSHYNENGLNIYTSKITIIFFILLLCFLFTSFIFIVINPLPLVQRGGVPKVVQGIHLDYDLVSTHHMN